MIDTKLLSLVSSKMPQINKKAMEGIAMSQLSEVEEYIHNTFRCAAESFPPGLKYIGGRRCTPLEQYREIIRPLKPKKAFEMLRSDVYLMKYLFTFNGIELRPFYIFLPFVSDGGIMFLKGTQYKVTPVLGGKVFNIEHNNIYMPTPRMRMGFSQYTVSCILNDKIVHSNCVASYLYNMNKVDRSVLYPTLMHYILAKYGLQTALLKLFNVHITVGKYELDKLSQQGYKVYRSRQIPYRKVISYEPSEVRIAIPENEYYPLLDNIISTVFYIIDNCTDATNEIEELENPKLWLRLLDRFIFKDQGTEKKRFEKMEEHLQNTENTYDPVTRRTLMSDSILCNDIFELFRYICLNYQDIVIHHDVGTMYYKELTTTKHLLFNVVYNIFIAMYELQKLPENLLTVEKISKVLIDNLRKDKIFSTLGHGELTSTGIATDCKYFGATGNMISHSKATAVAGSKRSKKTTNDPGLLLHESQVEVATYAWITNRCPHGRSKINPFINFGEKFQILPSPQLEHTLTGLRELLRKNKR